MKLYCLLDREAAPLFWRSSLLLLKYAATRQTDKTLRRMPSWLWNTFLLTSYDLGVSLSTLRLLLAGVFTSAVARRCNSFITAAKGENQA
ncbi:hypothetical protein HT123_13075 [Pseudomonas sp. MAFF 301512]|uniref:Uncharacterized protein n=1 Tax=Pseudomonas allii TaxID=2740531 RepID=A0A7Y8RMZ6_9PSED|nr:hypothetical protein [Pseudomonas allii]NWN62011.1 hypothetical protein [Pseudomonas allii]